MARAALVPALRAACLIAQICDQHGGLHDSPAACSAPIPPPPFAGGPKLIPVDLYIPAVPPRPEAIFDAVIKLRKKGHLSALAQRGQPAAQPPFTHH